MATYFVEPISGSNSNAGTSAALPFATIAKVIGSSGVGVNGDVAYLAPGVYREAFTVGISPASEVQVIGDVLRSQAWVSTILPGPVRWTSWTTSDFVTTGSTTTTLTASGKNFLTFQDIWFQGAGSPVVSLTSGCHDWVFRRCLIQGHYNNSSTI